MISNILSAIIVFMFNTFLYSQCLNDENINFYYFDKSHSRKYDSIAEKYYFENASRNNIKNTIDTRTIIYHKK